MISAARKGKPAHNDQRITIPCAECSTPVKIPQAWAKRNEQTFCSRQCNGAARGRQWATHGHKGSAARKNFVGLKMEKNPAWKGGVTYKRPKGNYVGPRYVRCPPEWLSMARADGYIMEHRLIMARRLGRPLLRTEVVNHINHDPRDNRRENLELYPSNGDHKRGEVGRYAPGVANRLFLTASAPL
jgi:endogenous inhibitor of DNA gyrase (YacG/DUF329 family)